MIDNTAAAAFGFAPIDPSPTLEGRAPQMLDAATPQAQMQPKQGDTSSPVSADLRDFFAGAYGAPEDVRSISSDPADTPQYRLDLATPKVPENLDVNPATDAFPVPDAAGDVAQVIAKGLKVDLATAHALARQPLQKDIDIGAFVSNGDVFVYVDAFDLMKVYSHVAKHLAYAYRFQVNMPDAGIEAYGSPTVLMDVDRPPTGLVRTEATPRVYRALFKLQRGL